MLAWMFVVEVYAAVIMDCLIIPDYIDAITSQSVDISKFRRSPLTKPNALKCTPPYWSQLPLALPLLARIVDYGVLGLASFSHVCV
jgi:hypothetical protein